MFSFQFKWLLLQIKHHPTPRRTTPHLSLLSFFYSYRYSCNIKVQMFPEIRDFHADDVPHKTKKPTEKYTQNEICKKPILYCKHVSF